MGKMGPSSFKEFWLTCREQERGPPCHSCNRVLTMLRAHCSSCGLIVCSVCLSGGMLSQLAKRHLGVTAPDAKDATVSVCSGCIRRLGVGVGVGVGRDDGVLVAAAHPDGLLASA